MSVLGRRPRLSSAVVAGALCLPGAAAHASGLELPGPGTTRSGVAAADAAAVHYNPGALGALGGGAALLGLGVTGGHARYTRERLGSYAYADGFDFALPVDEADVDPDKTGRAAQVRDTPMAPIGDAFVAGPLGGGRVTFGGGVYVPFGAVLRMPHDGAQRWVVQDVTLLVAAATPAVSVAVTDALSVGLSLPLYAGVSELSRVQDFAEVAEVGVALSNPPIGQPNDFGPDAPTGVRELDVLARPFLLSRATAARPTFGLGVFVQPTDAWTLGASYVHKAPLTFSGDAQLDMDDDFFTQDLVEQGLAFEPLVEGRGTLGVVLPWTLRVGASWHATVRHKVGVALAVVGWSTVKALDVRIEADGLEQPTLGLPRAVSLAVPRAWRNTVDAEFVHEVAAGDGFDVWYGAGLHSPASPDETMDLAAIDGWRVTAGLGGSLRLAPRLAGVLDAEVQTVPGRTVASSRHDIGNGDYALTLFRFGGHLDLRF